MLDYVANAAEINTGASSPLVWDCLSILCCVALKCFFCFFRNASFLPFVADFGGVRNGSMLGQTFGLRGLFALSIGKTR